MSTKTHKKLCWNCDGYVHIYEMQCPYCGVKLSDQTKEAKSKPVESSTSSSLSQSLESHQPAPAQETAQFQPPYQAYGAQLSQEGLVQSQPEPSKSSLEQEGELPQNPTFTLLMLLPGSLLFLLGLSMLLFSKDGWLTFQFKAKFFYLYLSVSLLMLYAGYRSLFPKKAREDKIGTTSFTNPLDR